MTNRPPMLVESDYDSWKIRIHRYIRGKPLGKLIWNSIQNGPSPHPMVTDAPTEGQTGVNMPRMKLDSEFTPEETNRENADTQAEIILSQWFPRHIFNSLNRQNTANEIGINCGMLMQGNEPIRDYFVRFHKLVNDMKITQLEIPTHQLNTKFVNNLPSYWGKYVTNIANLLVVSRAVSTFLNPTNKPAPGHLQLEDTCFGSRRAKLLLKKNVQRRAPGWEGHVARQCKEPKRAKDSQYFKDKMLLMEAKEKGVTLDAEAEAFLANVECTAPYDQPLAMATTNIFEVNHEDAYDSDVDEGPNAAAAFMANLSSTSGNNHHVNEANTHSRTAYTEKLSALTAENAKLKTELISKISSGPTTSEKPKVLAPGMYAISPKYIPPRRRVNRAIPTPLPKKQQVTFQETPRLSNKPTQKPPVQKNKKTNVPVNLSTRTKPATESHKPMPKSHTRNHRILPSKSVNVRRAAYHNRKLNVVDHNQFVIRSLKFLGDLLEGCWLFCFSSSVETQWKPTGRHFALYDNCPLTRIMEPIVSR
ncbi:hypothetical protein Tco_1525121 [Tanacetum coccineum]